MLTYTKMNFIKFYDDSTKIKTPGIFLICQNNPKLSFDKITFKAFILQKLQHFTMKKAFL